MNRMQILMQLMSSGKNPQDIIQDLVMKNPNSKALMNQMKQSGMNPKQFVEQLAKQNNFNLADILNAAQKQGIKL